MTRAVYLHEQAILNRERRRGQGVRVCSRCARLAAKLAEAKAHIQRLLDKRENDVNETE